MLIEEAQKVGQCGRRTGMDVSCNWKLFQQVGVRLDDSPRHIKDNILCIPPINIRMLPN